MLADEPGGIRLDGKELQDEGPRVIRGVSMLSTASLPELLECDDSHVPCHVARWSNQLRPPTPPSNLLSRVPTVIQFLSQNMHLTTAYLRPPHQIPEGEEKKEQKESLRRKTRPKQ
jgi:hypothetical protein